MVKVMAFHGANKNIMIYWIIHCGLTETQVRSRGIISQLQNPWNSYSYKNELYSYYYCFPKDSKF